MRLSTTDSLFPWDKLPDSPDLAALRFLLDLLPDQPLLAALRRTAASPPTRWSLPARRLHQAAAVT